MFQLPDNFESLESKEIVQLLETIPVGETIRLRVKERALDEDWQYTTAVRSEGSWVLTYDGKEKEEIVQDSDEGNTLMSANNWTIGWFSFVPPMQMLACETPVSTIHTFPCIYISESASYLYMYLYLYLETLFLFLGLFKDASNEQLAIQCGAFKFSGEQIEMDCGVKCFRLFSSVTLNDEDYLKPKDFVKIEKEIHLFFYAAVQVEGDKIEENEAEYAAVIYNLNSRQVEFAKFSQLQKFSEIPPVMHIDFCELDEILIQIFTCPVVTEFQFSDVTPNNHGDLKLIETPASPEVDSSSTKKTSGESKATIGNKRPGPRRIWASGKRHRTLKQPFDPAAEAQKKPLVNLRPRVNPVLNPNPLTRGSNRVAKAKQGPSKNPTLNIRTRGKTPRNKLNFKNLKFLNKLQNILLKARINQQKIHWKKN